MDPERIASMLEAPQEYYTVAELLLLDMDGKMIEANHHRANRLSIQVQAADGNRTAPNGKVIKAVFDFTLYAHHLERHYSCDGYTANRLREYKYNNYLAVKLYTEETVEIIVHRQILIAGSRYFDCALRGYFLESVTGEICLDDISFDDLIAYLKLAHRYFFLRFEDDTMPTSSLWVDRMNQIKRNVLSKTKLKVPRVTFAEVLRLIVLADRFMSHSLVIFIRQIFLRLLGTTAHCWIDNNREVPDMNHKIHQAFITNYLDAHKLLSRCADEDRYLRQAIAESFHNVSAYNQSLRNAMLIRTNASGDDGEAFRTDWFEFQVQLLPGRYFIAFNEEAVLRNMAYNEACKTAIAMTQRNDLFALLKRRAIEKLQDARARGKAISTEITWTTGPSLAAGTSTPVLGINSGLPAASSICSSDAVAQDTNAPSSNNTDSDDSVSTCSFDYSKLDYETAFRDESEESEVEDSPTASEPSDEEWIYTPSQGYQSQSKSTLFKGPVDVELARPSPNRQSTGSQAQPNTGHHGQQFGNEQQNDDYRRRRGAYRQQNAGRFQLNKGQCQQQIGHRQANFSYWVQQSSRDQHMRGQQHHRRGQHQQNRNRHFYWGGQHQQSGSSSSRTTSLPQNAICNSARATTRRNSTRRGASNAARSTNPNQNVQVVQTNDGQQCSGANRRSNTQDVQQADRDHAVEEEFKQLWQKPGDDTTGGPW
ncbi:hypothetical protein ACHAQA_004359 [Verticillium albo-atrum]